MATTKLCFLDFEFNQTAEPLLNLVCVSILTNDGQRFDEWLHKSDEGKAKTVEYLNKLNDEGYEFVAYAVTAEARSFISLGLDPLKFKWVDLYVYYRMLLNQNDRLMYGYQLIDGKVKYTRRPTYDKIDGFDYSKPNYGMAAACFKLLNKDGTAKGLTFGKETDELLALSDDGLVIDTAHKTKMRDLIISNPDEFTEDERKDIMSYCHGDVKYLQELYKGMLLENNLALTTSNIKWGNDEQKKIRHKFSEYAVRTAIMESLGYPIDVEATENFIKNVPKIIRSCVEDILSQDLPIKPFKWNAKFARYSECQKELKAFISEHYKDRKWRRTDKGAISLSLDAFSDHSSSRHEFKRDNLIDQMLRYKKLMQHLNGFRPKAPTAKNKKTFKDSLGSDGRVRPYFGIYGAQSSRSQPSATGFLFLKSAWIRALCQPKKGRVVVGIDFGSQENLLAGLISNDDKMLKAYESGDPYLYFAKLAGAVPWDGTKEEYKKERNLFKSTCLGVSYNMGAGALAQKITDDTGEPTTKEQAQELIDKFFEAYTDFAKWNDYNKEKYSQDNPIILPCGWTMWCDNNNWRSVNNVPIQGMGASIMRKAVALAQDSGLQVIKTLHDALYIECDLDNYEESAILLANCMDDATKYYFEGDLKEKANVRLDADVWGHDLEEGYKEVKYQNGVLPIVTKDKYIDPRSKKEYEFFKKYFE
jgi:hypothetical protein